MNEKINHETILLIMNCKKYRKKALLQKQTWIKKLPKEILYFHVIADVDLFEDYVFNFADNLLIVRSEDDYINLPKKVIAAYLAINETFNFKYIFKTDDDQNIENVIFFTSLIKYLRKNGNNYGGFIINISKPQISSYNLIHNELPNNLVLQTTRYCSGRFYFLSQYAVTNLLSKKNKIEEEYLEDYAIGYNLDLELKKNILFLDTNRNFCDFHTVLDV